MAAIVLILVGLAGLMFIAFLCVVFWKPKSQQPPNYRINPQHLGGNQPQQHTYSQQGLIQSSGPSVPPLPPLPGISPSGTGMANNMGGRTLYIPPTLEGISGQTVFLPEGGGTDGTINFLPAYFEVIGGGEKSNEESGARKELYSLRGNYEFGIGRVDDRMDFANYIPIRSVTVSKDANTQGKLIYDPATGQYFLVNLADPVMKKNPIRINTYTMATGEQRRLITGDIVDVGDVKLKFYEGR